jgi:pilus assembly protein CpaE
VIVIVDPSAELRARLAEAVPEDDVFEVAGLEEARAMLQQSTGRGRIAVLGPGLERSEVLAFAEKAERQRDGTATLLVAQTLEPGLLREAMRSGVDDILTVNASADEWAEAVARTRGRITAEHDLGAGTSDAGNRGRMVSVFSTKGGCGKSLVASNLAVLAAERLKQRTALVDLDLQSGDLAIMFQVMPALSIYDAALDADRLDQEALEGYFTGHRSGVSLLAAPLEPSLAEQVEPDGVKAILELLPSMFPLTIVDGPPLFTDQMLLALDVSDDIVLVGSMDVPSIKNLKLAISTITQLGHPREQLKIVLNRADSKVGLRTNEVEKSLGVEIDVQIPSSRDVPLSINQGTPLAMSRPRSPVVQAIAELLPAVLPGTASDERGGRFRRR